MNDQLFNSTVQSLVRAGLMAAAGALAIEVRAGDLESTVGVVTSIVLTLVSVLWSYFNHTKNINSPPPPGGTGGTGSPLAFIGLILTVGALSFGTINMAGCKGGGITAAQVQEYRQQADAAEAELQTQIDNAKAEGNTAAAEKAQAILDKFHEERAKWESKVKLDAQGNVDVESSIATAAMVAAPPGIGAIVLVALSLFKRYRAVASTPPAVPPTT